MKFSTLLVACLISLPLFSMKEEHHLAVLFETASHELDQQARDALDVFLSDFSADDDISVLITGHTDARGSVDYNSALANRRSQEVRNYLLSRGFHPMSVVSHSFGEANPKYSNSSEEGMAGNRRVDVSLTQHRFSSKEELLEELGLHNRASFKIDPSQQQIITSQRGSIVAIPAYSFANQNGELVDEVIDFTIVEALDPLDFVASKLSCVSGDELIETGGMMQITASVNGEELQLADSASIMIALPPSQLEQGMQLFVSNNGSDWDATGQKPLGMEDLVFPPIPVADYVGYKEPAWNFDLPPVPHKPSSPLYPREPREPNLSAYDIEFKWYQFFGKGKKIMRAEEARQAKIDLYEKQLERFEDRKIRYAEEMKDLPERAMKYASDSIAYFAAIDSAEAHYQTVTLPKSRADWERSVAKYREQHLDRIAVWQLACDSIRSVRIEELAEAGALGMAPLSQYVYSVNRMGWINCDRFMSVPPEEKQDIIVSTGKVESAAVCLAFNDIKSMMQLHPMGESYVGNGIPRNADATMFAYFVDDDGDIMLASTDLQTKDHYKLSFKSVTLAELRAFLTELSGRELQASL